MEQKMLVDHLRAQSRFLKCDGNSFLADVSKSLLDAADVIEKQSAAISKMRTAIIDGCGVIMRDVAEATMDDDGKDKF